MPLSHLSTFFFFNDTATTEIYTLSLHDALPICPPRRHTPCETRLGARGHTCTIGRALLLSRRRDVTRNALHHPGGPARRASRHGGDSRPARRGGGRVGPRLRPHPDPSPARSPRGARRRLARRARPSRGDSRGALLRRRPPGARFLTGGARYTVVLARFRPCGFSPSALDRKSTRLNSSHGYISYAVFCLKKKK